MGKTKIHIPYKPNAKQQKFHNSKADECFYGGAKGGGKSHALVMEALVYGLTYPGATMYIFRETYDDLEASIVRKFRANVDKRLYTYNGSQHMAKLINGTEIYFRYCSSDADADGYQGHEMDWLGIDEMTLHSEYEFSVLKSCLRSPKGYPTQIRGTGNPGGKGHKWVKERYITATNYGNRKATDKDTGTSIEFIPAFVDDNEVLMTMDPSYKKRLEHLPPDRRKAYLEGDWDIFEGQYFEEFDRKIHVCQPFPIPAGWNKYRALDYGLDMFAGYWIAVNRWGKSYVYREVYESRMLAREAARLMRELTNEEIYESFAPPDLWNTNSQTGLSFAEVFAEEGIDIRRTDNNRIMGWSVMKEAMKVYEGPDGEKMANFCVFSNCPNLIRCLQEIQYDVKNVGDVAKEPHELTHAPDAIRYYFAGRPESPVRKEEKKERLPWALRGEEETEVVFEW